MAKKQRPSFQKRQKELSRQQKQKEKEARRQERKLQRETGTGEEEVLRVLDGPQDFSLEPGEGLPTSLAAIYSRR